MQVIDLGDIHLHYEDRGPADGQPIVFANSLGTDFRLWDKIVPRLQPGLRIVRYDKRGHGLSACPPGPYAMGALVRDAERLIEALDIRDCIFVGLSIGGMIAQGLAAKRPDLVKAVVLSNTAAKIGTREIWEERIAAVRKGGIEAIADTVLERWFSAGFRQGPEFLGWRAMLTRTPLEGYVGCSAAIAGTDFYTTTAALAQPVLGIGGDLDGSTPPDLVRETAELAPNGRFELIRGAGHLPCVERPDEYAAILGRFIAEVTA
ncbi:MAG: 3-oxoadipate enol-lactonase [Alphaproteobacteria bacterium]|nr:MAG: 3-oxoadipate enol-lactonase [Alphaproteobacteria bacterium]